MRTGISEVHDVMPSLWSASECVLLEADTAVYPVAAAIATGYRFSDRAFVWLQSSERTGSYHICVKPKTASDDRVRLADAFVNELLDQTLRLHLNQQFGPLRTLITAQAFAEGNLLDSVSAPEQAPSR
jgi:His-Xaa-Ser system protein HxsD